MQRNNFLIWKKFKKYRKCPALYKLVMKRMLDEGMLAEMLS